MKRRYKITPVSIYDIRGLEQWLEKMAAKGLFLKHYRPLVCTFTKGEPRRVRYRLEPSHLVPLNSPPEDMLELFQGCGWTYVGHVHREMLIFSSDDPHAPELHTDPDIQLEQWGGLYQKARKELWQMTLLALACLAVCAALLFWGGTPLARLLLLQSGTIFVTLYFFLFPLKELAVNFTRARELSDIIRELEGRPKKRWPWFPSRQFFSWLGAAAIAGLLALLLFVSQTPDWGGIRSIDTSPLTLSVLEDGQSSEDSVLTGRPGWSLLCWRQWDMWQFRQGSSLYIQWFDLPDGLSFLAVPAARDLMNNALKLDDTLWSSRKAVAWVTREYPEAGADWLAIADSEDGVYHIAAAVLGDKVVRVRYSGPGDLADQLDAIVDMARQPF